MSPSDLEKLFYDIFTRLDYPHLAEYAIYFAMLVYLVLLIALQLIVFFGRRYIRRRKRLGDDLDLNPYFDEEDIEEYTSLFIPTKFQFFSPTRGYDLQGLNDDKSLLYYLPFLKPFFRGRLLIDFLINNAFHRKSRQRSLTRIKRKTSSQLHFLTEGKQREEFSRSKFVIVLADTGMGKTAFMINLYLEYTKKWYRKHKIVLIPFTTHDIDEKIRNLPDKKKTILLLDGLDEDKQAMENCEARKEEILRIVRDFKKVIITCRSQFFFHEHLEWEETDIPQARKTNYKFFKVYISPFSNSDVNYFLIKKYGLFTERFHIARTIVERIPYLMVRPIILKYIDDFVDRGYGFDSLREIYEMIVDKWIAREKFNVPASQHSAFQANMLIFSAKIARFLYEHPEKEFIVLSEDIDHFATSHSIPLNALELKNKSLLNRGESNHYKFAHKSILEYFLAESLYHDLDFLTDFNREGNQAAVNFFKDKCFELHTVPFLKACAKMEKVNPNNEDRDLLAVRLSGLGIPESTTYNITFKRTGQSDNLQFNWGGYRYMIWRLKITRESDLADDRVFIPLEYLRELNIVSCNVTKLDFLKFLNLDKLIFSGCTLTDELIDTIKNNNPKLQVTISNRVFKKAS